MRRSNRSRGDCYNVARIPHPGHYQDDGARARSARIRSSYDYEGTHPEEMRRRTAAMEPAVAPLRTRRLNALIARIARLRVHEKIEEAPPDTSIAD
jgi:hypothetical protein